jgi:hypothetical protein
MYGDMYGEARDAGYDSKLSTLVLTVSVIKDGSEMLFLGQVGVELAVLARDGTFEDSGDVGWVIESDLPGRRPARRLYE